MEMQQIDGPTTAVSCRHCGCTVDEPPLGWSTEGDRWLCDTCTRRNLRAIEGKIDDAWW